MSDTIAAIATGAQTSAIGIVRISGEKAIGIVDSLFAPASGRAMSSYQDRRLVYGQLRDENGDTLDLCLCTVSRAPNSYTGEDTAELQCHGSPTVLRAALDAIFSLGARQAGPGEFTKRAFLNGRMDLTGAEAVADMIEAETAEAAKNAAGQLAGAISRKTREIYSALTDISAHYHAVLDYPDEDIEDFRMESYKSELRSAADTLGVLYESYGSGRLLRDGVPAAIIGRPNAGKSSLLNALLGYDRAIVTDVPGTTRDTIEERVKIGEVLLRLTDTAGLRESDDKIERLGVERSRAALGRSELALVVIDGSAPFTDEDARIIEDAKRCPKALLVLSKADLEAEVALPDAGLPAVRVSAHTGAGLDELRAAVKKLFPLPVRPAGEILTNARQADAVHRALTSVNAALDAVEQGYSPDIVLTETEEAMSALGELSGSTVREDVTNRIFSRFCVGK